MSIHAAIIGAHKCGTTALLEMLRGHPDVVAHVSGQFPAIFGQEGFVDSFPEVYQEYFGCPAGGAYSVIRETSLYLDIAAVERLYKFDPSVRLLLLVRDPVARAHSAFHYARSKGFDNAIDFRQTMEEQRTGPLLPGKPLICNYVRMGQYRRNLAAIEQVFPSQQICVVSAESLRAAPEEALARVFAQLGLRYHEVGPVIANETRQARSERLARILKGEGALKQLYRAIVPMRARLRVNRFISSLNQLDVRPPPISGEDAEFLRNLYRRDSQQLLADYGVNVMVDWPDMADVMT